MKVSLKRHLRVFPKLRRRLSSVRWALLLITTAMFFLSAASTGCPTGSYIISLLPANLPINNNSSASPVDTSTSESSQSSSESHSVPNLPGVTAVIHPAGSVVAGSPAANLVASPTKIILKAKRGKKGGG
jgi:hypothetical protein